MLEYAKNELYVRIICQWQKKKIKNQWKKLFGKALSRYYVMYFKNSYEKAHLVEAYEKYQLFRKREIAKLNLENYRLYPDIPKIKSFLEQLLSINDFDVWLMYELSMRNPYNRRGNIF